MFQVFDNYVDDCRNTDNAWVEIIVLNIHLDSTTQVLADVNNVVRTWMFTLPDRRSAVMQCDGYVIVFLIGHEQLRLSWVAGGELQNKTQLKPKRIPALGGQAAEEQVQILPRFTPLHWKRLRNPAAVEMSKLTHIMLSQHIFRDPTVLLHTHTHAQILVYFKFQRFFIVMCTITQQISGYLKN